MKKNAFESEFPESLVSDSKFRDSRLKTRNRTRTRPRYFSIQSLGLGIEVPRHSRLKGRKCPYLWLFEGKKAESDSKFRDSRLRTRNRSRNRNRFFTMQCLGLGIGLGILTYKVSVSVSGLENRDSGNSDVPYSAPFKLLLKLLPLCVMVLPSSFKLFPLPTGEESLRRRRL